mmetsp:Transcript_11060/g.12656  ORF Transcript_11060/g.12656 Transcript_11060/m.12656 type:complete len:397 (+) Transcript_11060:223-1413(+)|eukprot:CAMPEP_0184016406 /NCGR_PEP_ID=MMETSP0954-20121128/6913_1 /TAXON_ID=627963 /ORGANISM="Aplanochytrium sp, Strain PBS07" /LENGTH=396 /DNA_ID=CAMNT_0026297427 /DNA_START=198 /DNA_END=1388 /DNA_ORIENTATION=+
MPVLTRYGPAYLLEEREDGLSVVKFPWGTGFVNPTDIICDHNERCVCSHSSLKHYQSTDFTELAFGPLLGLSFDSFRRRSSMSLVSADVSENGTITVRNSKKPDVEDKFSLDVGSAYTQQYIFIGIWILMLFSNWLLNKLLCTAGYPSKCLETNPWAADEVFRDLEALLLYGFVMAWICNLTKRSRFWSLYSKERFWFFVIFFITPPIFSAFTEIPNLNLQLATDPTYNTTEVVILSLMGLGVAIVLGWHYWYARNHLDDAECFVYIMSRGAIVLFYAVNVIIIVINDDRYIVDFHHYLIAFSLSTVCQFDHVVSLVMLSVCAGIFVQGVAVNEYTSLFSERVNCIANITQTNSINVSSVEPFYVRFCLIDDEGQPDLFTAEGLTVNNVEAWPEID